MPPSFLTVFRFASLAALLWLPLTPAVAQLFDRLSNPQVSVTLTNPPGFGLKVSKIVFGPPGGRHSNEIVEILLAHFREYRLEALSPAGLSALLAENNARLNDGYIDSPRAAALGKILGPSALLFVKVQRYGTAVDHYGSKGSRYDRDTKRSYEIQLYNSRTRAALQLSIQTVDLSSGRIFQPRTLDYAPERVATSDEGYPPAPDGQALLDGAVQAMVGEVHRWFFPWKETRMLFFFDDEAGGLRQAYLAMKAGDLERAFILSEQNLQTCKAMPKVKDKLLAHAHHNLGISYFVRGEPENALAYFREAARLRPGGIASETLASCERAIALKTAMQQVDERTAVEVEKHQMQQLAEAQAAADAALTNAGVIQMAQQRVPDGVIIAKITRSACKFDTSPSALAALSQAGVSEQVIVAMMEKL